MKLIRVVKNDAEELRPRIVEFFKNNPNPGDDVLHKWAEENNLDVHEVETEIYRLVTEYIQEKFK
jgi:hypothetical protein